MSNYLITEVNCETGEVIERKMTEAETIQRTKDNDAYNVLQEELKIKLLAKAALLDKLGITEDEARLLLGGN